MKMSSKIARAVAALAAVGSVGTASIAVAAAQSTATPTTIPAVSQNIVEIAASNPDFSTLVMLPRRGSVRP